MSLVMIPQQSTHADQSVVPICVRTTDPSGLPINPGWIDALATVADPIRHLARTQLGDIWRASELADETVQDLWRVHRDELGPRPGSLIRVHARWKAFHKRFGRPKHVSLSEVLVEQLPDPFDLATEYERRQLIAAVAKRLAELSPEEVQLVFRLFLEDCEPKEIAARLQTSRNAIYKRLWRYVRRAFNSL